MHNNIITLLRMRQFYFITGIFKILYHIIKIYIYIIYKFFAKAQLLWSLTKINLQKPFNIISQWPHSQFLYTSGVTFRKSNVLSIPLTVIYLRITKKKR